MVKCKADAECPKTFAKMPIRAAATVIQPTLSTIDSNSSSDVIKTF